MCELCFRNSWFELPDLSKANIQSKKYRAGVIKELIKLHELNNNCSNSKTELEKLKEEQYRLAREI